MLSPQHTPVLVKELLQLWQPKPGDRLLDATLGLGGHSEVFLQATHPTGTVVGVDADPKAIEVAKKRLEQYGDRVKYIVTHSNHLKDSVNGGGILLTGFTHVLFDLGIGSHQLSDETRGFSFSSKGPLIMKYGGDEELPPADLRALNRLEHRLNRLPDVWDCIHGLLADELAEVLRTYGEERFSGRIATILKEKTKPDSSAQQIAEFISSSVPASYRKGRIHPATRSFQAFRLAVNRELECLKVGLPQAFELLESGGILTVISFHSLEDRIVKQFMREVTKVCICPPEQPQCTCSRIPQAELLTKKPIGPSGEEENSNPRARSAKLRSIRKK